MALPLPAFGPRAAVYRRFHRLLHVAAPAPAGLSPSATTSAHAPPPTKLSPQASYSGSGNAAAGQSPPAAGCQARHRRSPHLAPPAPSSALARHLYPAYFLAGHSSATRSPPGHRSATGPPLGHHRNTNKPPEPLFWAF
ncbi:uncharacterized protein LOC131035198 [Cryptomeria japonica]|uniref:uncharacterized protein LOC131035198 n=1 Tax=Cryptomeria japonica TaxID=3369 RepID=UPI0025AB6233|nr:uncharacterized protein LOC131035198 [Cryptomeria japonica]